MDKYVDMDGMRINVTSMQRDCMGNIGIEGYIADAGPRHQDDPYDVWCSTVAYHDMNIKGMSLNDGKKILKNLPEIKKIYINTKKLSTVVWFKDDVKVKVKLGPGDVWNEDAAINAAIVKRIVKSTHAYYKDIHKKIVYQNKKEK